VKIREIQVADIPALFAVRVVTHENRMTLEELAAVGVTPESVRRRLESSFRGWLCEVDDRIVGFAMGDGSTGEMEVIAVLPEFIGRGIGSALLRRVEDWLFAQGCAQLWLTTDVDPSLKAYGFYRQHGWTDERIERGLRRMVKRAA
jgi:GNAT superfamily N-acetyltransferase